MTTSLRSRPGRLGRTIALTAIAVVIPVGGAAAAAKTAPGKSAPVATSAPSISGSAVVGATLGVSMGSWSGGPTGTYSVSWNRCDSQGAGCVPIQGAATASYGVGTVDLGAALRAVVVASNKNGSTAAVSPPTTAVTLAATPAQSQPATTTVAITTTPATTTSPVVLAPTSVSLPVVSGSAQVGQSLSASTGSWSGSVAAYGYQWMRCDVTGASCVTAVGATSPSYLLAIGDAGSSFRVDVSASNSGGTTVAVSAATSAVPTPVAPTASFSKFGLAAGASLPWLSSSDQSRYLDLAKQMGVGIVRFDIDWSQIQPSSPSSYNWSAQDAVVHNAAARGISVLGTIAYTPGWARPSGTTDKYPPTNASDYGTFCGAAARHYVPMGVTAFEVWNEPNISNFFMPTPDVAKYTQMLKACYTAIKAVAPSATVVTGGTSPAGKYNDSGSSTTVNGINWLQGIYANGGKGYFDAVGNHPYSFPYDPSTQADWSAWYQMYGTSPSLRSVMIANNDGNKQIWATEWGAPTNGPSGSGFVSETTQAAQVTQAFSLWRTYSWAGPLFVYDFRDDGTTTDTRENFFGLIHNDWTLKPAYNAYRTAATT